MRRADRLFELVGRLKGVSMVTAEALAAVMEVSVRTVYRDIATLQAQGLPIEGQAGVGYMLRGRLDLPPLTFDHDQLEALALGLAYVERVGDPDLALAARVARGKIETAWSGREPAAGRIRVYQHPERRAPAFAAALRGAARARRVVGFAYRDAEGRAGDRRARPLALVAFSEGWMLIGWCLTREDFRTFRLDRMAQVAVTDEAFENDPERNFEAYLASMPSKEARARA